MEQMKKQRGILIVLSGPSGTGKGTICAAIQKTNLELAISISATTRQPRGVEQDGKEYFFYTREKFERLLDSDGFLEWAQVYDNYYGTPRAFVEEVLASGRDCILEIDPQGALKVRKASSEAVLIFVAPPSMEELRNRLAGRKTETLEQMEKRLSCAYTEISFADQYDYVIINDDVEAAVAKMQAILTAERCKAWRQCDKIHF